MFRVENEGVIVGGGKMCEIIKIDNGICVK